MVGREETDRPSIVCCSILMYSESLINKKGRLKKTNGDFFKRPFCYVKTGLFRLQTCHTLLVAIFKCLRAAEQIELLLRAEFS